VAKRGPMSTTRKVLLSAALLAAAASIAGFGTYATFTSSTTPVAHTLAAGTVTIALGATGAETNRLDVGASGIAPGDTIERSIDLVNTSSLALASLTLTTTASASSVLNTDGTNGLQMQIDECSQAWTESGPPYTYTCGGTTSVVLASQSVIGTDLALSNLTLAAGGGTDHVRVKLTFPSASTIGQGASSTISYQFTATQRAAMSK
jgi:spore coat-associated protein N